MSELRAPTFVQACQENLWPNIVHRKMHVITLSPEVCKLVHGVARDCVAVGMDDRAPPLPSNHCWVEMLAPIPFDLSKGAGDGLVYVHAFFIAKARTGLSAVWLVSSEGASGIDDCYLHYFVHLDRQGIRLEPWAPTPGITRDNERRALFACEALIGAVCGVLAAPGTSTTVEKVREADLKKVPSAPQAPLVTYRCVDVNLDALTQEHKIVLRNYNSRGPGVALHGVRGHWRRTAKGYVPVRPHFRGDARFGVRLRDHNMKRDEEVH